MRAAVDVAAGDRAAERVGVLGDREDVVRRRRAAGDAAVLALHDVPAVVAAARARVEFAVDLLVAILADVGDEEVAGRAVEADPPRVAQAPGPDCVGAGRADERVVRRDRVIAVRRRTRVPFDVDAQDLAEQRRSCPGRCCPGRSRRRRRRRRCRGSRPARTPARRRCGSCARCARCRAGWCSVVRLADVRAAFAVRRATMMSPSVASCSRRRRSRWSRSPGGTRGRGGPARRSGTIREPTSRNDAACSVPPLTTRTLPPRWTTNSRPEPSPAWVTPSGLLRPPVTRTTVSCPDAERRGLDRARCDRSAGRGRQRVARRDGHGRREDGGQGQDRGDDARTAAVRRRGRGVMG